MLRSLLLCPPAIVLLFAHLVAGADDDRDTDGDGVFDTNEQILGSDPASADLFSSIIEDGLENDQRRAQAGYDATKDVVSVEFCHVGGDRYLWRVTMADEPRLEDTVLHLYVDADANQTTGRKVKPGAPNHGTEYMLSVVGGNARSTLYGAEGNSGSGPPVSFVVQDNCVILSADVDLRRDLDGIRYDLYVLCHTTSQSDGSPSMSDSSRKRPIAKLAVSERSKIMRPVDYQENYGVRATFGIAAVTSALRASDVIVVPHDKLASDGFCIDHFTTRRWPHVRRERNDASVSTRVSEPGRYHVGFMMYDDSNDERVAIHIDDQLCGVAVARQDNNRTWLYWLDEAREFRGDEQVELRAVGGGGKHGICNILFLRKPPEERSVELRVENTASMAWIDDPGTVTISWTTTRPCPTKLEYGSDSSLGESFESDGNCLVHRVVLKGLDPQKTYRARAIGTSRDGTLFFGEEFEFRVAAPGPPETTEDFCSVPLAVRNPHPAAVEDWPITTGVPFPQGQLGSAEDVRLVYDEKEVPVQVRLAARWPDGSVKWLLVSFTADVPEQGESEYQLQYGCDVQPAPVTEPLVVNEEAAGVVIDTGVLTLTVDRHGNLTDLRSLDASGGRQSPDSSAGRSGDSIRGLTSPARQLIEPPLACETTAVDVDGVEYRTQGKAAVTVEERGPLRVVVKTVSPLIASDGSKLMRIEQRIEAYRGSALLRIHHTFVVEGEDKFTELEQLTFRVPAAVKTDANGRYTFLILTTSGSERPTWNGEYTARQLFDSETQIGGIEDGKDRRRLTGMVCFEGPPSYTVCVRDFWQNYPKAFTASENALNISLCPDFPPGTYDGFPFEKEGHQLYYYLQDGRYRLKRGLAKTHELLLCFEPPERHARLSWLCNRPLLATVPPRWYADAKVFYDLAPRNEERFKLYEDAIDRNIRQYADRRERQHDFGMLNYGDWYGERGSNWGNVEYDTQHAFFLEYARSGNPDAFFLGHATELHNRDIDTVQWSEDPKQVGAVYVHQMCHVGDYFDRSVPGTLGFPRGGFTVSHAWVEGHFDHYFLTGDRRSYETGCAVADYFTRKQLGRPYDFSSCRTPGWHLIMLASAYAATNDPYYLNAAKVIVERVLDSQEKEPRPLPANQVDGRQPYQVGGWSRMMVPGHCHCEPRHRGNAGFMVAVLLSGLKYYHDVTGDPRVKEAIIRGAYYLLDETYSDEAKGFRYTSCPETGYRPGASPLMVEGIARAYLWTGDQRFRRVLTQSLPLGAGGSSYGKGFSMYYRMAPRVLADLNAAGITMNEQPGED
jgi:hypothetical protein